MFDKKNLHLLLDNSVSSGALDRSVNSTGGRAVDYACGLSSGLKRGHGNAMGSLANGQGRVQRLGVRSS